MEEWRFRGRSRDSLLPEIFVSSFLLLIFDNCCIPTKRKVEILVRDHGGFDRSAAIHFGGFRIINIRMDSSLSVSPAFIRVIVQGFIDVLLSPYGSFDSQYIPSFGFNGIGTGFITPFHARRCNDALTWSLIFPITRNLT